MDSNPAYQSAVIASSDNKSVTMDRNPAYQSTVIASSDSKPVAMGRNPAYQSTVIANKTSNDPPREYEIMILQPANSVDNDVEMKKNPAYAETQFK